MNRIKLLDDVTINKIAAGEVIDRPASIVKELVENSIDASASRVVVEIVNGGVDRIKIIDDGVGIPAEDVEIAFQRHTTSKLRKIEDMGALYSNGFRGEALSSIAAVAHVDIVTNTDDKLLGKHATFFDGAMKHIGDIGAKKGTVIKIEGLFDNVPARKKFLKSSSSETTQITDILSRLAIFNNSIAFKYISNGKEIFNTIGDGEMLNAIISIYGKQFANNLIPISSADNVVRIEGYISNTTAYQSNRKKQNIFINKRVVRSSPLYYVVENIYKDLIPIGKYPAFFLDIHLEAAFIDPNVHPSKLEVKISDEVDVSGLLKNELRAKLFESSQHLIPKSAMIIKSYHDTDDHIPLSENKFEYKEFQMMPNNAENNREEIISKHGDKAYADQIPSDIFFVKEDLPKEKIYSENDSVNTQELLFEHPAVLDYRFLNIIGVAFNTYIIVSYDQSVYFIDQHAAHERILYEKFLTDIKKLAAGEALPSQELLIADIREFSTFEHQKILQNASMFAMLGFQIEDFGFNRIAIRSYPLIFNQEQGLDFFESIASLLFSEKKIGLDEEFNDRIARMACKKAIKANHSIGQEEIKLLFEQLNDCENKYTCPHGRPIFVEFTKKSIEKMFKRIV